MQKIELSLIGR